MDVKATHKMPISSIAVMAFSATSVQGKCIGNILSSAAPEERLIRQDDAREKKNISVP